MISIKMNKNGDLVLATGIRTRSNSIYMPNQKGDFKVSRSKFNDFLACERCFYLDRVKGLRYPSIPGWALNETTDILLKKEFDACRQLGLPHRSFEKFGLENIVPFQHDDMDIWRDSLHHGLSIRFEDTNIILHGGVDDIWFNQLTEELIVVDYKSQSSNINVTSGSYLSNIYHKSYKTQLDFYAYLLTNMKFKVAAEGYFYVCNGLRDQPDFNGRILFDETIVPYSVNFEWIPEKIHMMIEVLNSPNVPKENVSCENCAYTRQRSLAL